MNIAIIRFEDRPPQQLLGQYFGSPVFGYWIRFKADIISGSALLVPSGSIEDIQRRPSPQELSVETGVKAYENFRPLEENAPRVYKFEPLPNPGDYDLTGKVSGVWTTEDGQLWIVRVIVDDFAFDLGDEDLKGIEVDEGAWVQFRVRELELSDENL